MPVHHDNFFYSFLRCEFQLRCTSIVTPKDLSSVTRSISMFWIRTFNSSLGSVLFFSDLKSIKQLLDIFMCSFFISKSFICTYSCFLHLYTQFRTCCTIFHNSRFKNQWPIIRLGNFYTSGEILGQVGRLRLITTACKVLVNYYFLILPYHIHHNSIYLFINWLLSE